MIAKGLGAIDISQLAATMQTGNIDPSYKQGQYFDAGFSPTPVQIPSGYYVDDATARQLAAALGGTVVSRVPENLVGTNIPLANFILLPNGQEVNAADIAQVATLQSPDKCVREASLMMAIPGAVASSECQQQINNDPTIQQGFQWTQQANADVGGCPGCVQVGSTSGTQNVASGNPVYGNQTSLLNNQPAGTAIPLNSTMSPSNATGSNTGNPTIGNTQSNGGNIISEATSWVTQSTVVTGIPNWALALGAVAALMVFTSHRG